MQEKLTLDYPATRLIGDLWLWLKPYRVRFVVTSVVRALSDLVQLYPAYALAALVTFLTGYSSGDDLAPLLHIGELWILSLLVRVTSREWSRFAAYKISERTSLDVQLKAFKHLFSLDLTWHEQSNAGNKIKRVQHATDGIDEILRMWTDRIVETVVQILGVILILASFDTTIALAVSGFALTHLPLSIILTRRGAQMSHQVNLANEDLSGVAYEAIGNVRSVKVLGMAQALMRLIHQATDVLYVRIQERILRFRTRDLVIQLYSQGYDIALLFFTAWQVINGHAEVGLVILVFDYFRRVNRSINAMSESAQQFLVAKYAIGRVRQLLDEPVMIEQTAGKKPVPKKWQSFTLENLSFSYGKKQALRNISLSIKRGEKVGIVGVSGSGKSTLFKLMLKEYENYRGTIAIDDVPLQSIRHASYTDHVAVVLQDTEVFNFSLRDNIALGNWKERKNEKQLKQAASIAHVTDFMNRLPEGFDTVIGEKGIRLSGGEKQRVGIARAVFKQPEILFMDEATSHLDSESEAKIQDSLQQFFKSVTAVVIAHRLSTIKQMDTIYVLEEGTVVESGSFKELLDKKGRFAQMWKRQQF